MNTEESNDEIGTFQEMEESLVGSPNWHEATCLDILLSRPDIVFYASRAFVYFMRIHEDPSCVNGAGDVPGNPLLTPIGFLPAHHERVSGVTAIAATGQESNVEFATCGHDRFARLWSYKELRCLRELNLAEHGVDSQVTCIAARPPPGSVLVVMGTEGGGVVLWCFKEGREEVLTRKMEREAVVTCAWPTKCDRSVFAVGFRGGIVAVYAIESGSKGYALSQLHRFKAHDRDVCSVSWHPDDIDQLASSGKDRSVKVWSLTNNASIRTVKVAGSAGVWMSACWTKKGPLAVSSGHGEVGLWDPSQGGSKWRAMNSGCLGKGHSRVVFAIKETASKRLVSTSMDRTIMLWDLESDRALVSVPTLGGFVYALSVVGSGGTLAVGSGDKLIRLWRLGGTGRPYEVSSLWDGVDGRVTAVAWHPTREGLLGYGTDDGRVGVVNTLSDRRKGRISNSHHKGTVFVVSWGPRIPVNPGEDWLSLYSVGNYQILCHDAGKMGDSEAVDAGQLLPRRVKAEGRVPRPTEIAFREEFKYLAIGCDDGSVELYALRPELRLVCVMTEHRKSVNVIRWHPSRPWLAIGTNARLASVIDLGDILSRFEAVDSQPQWTPPIVTESIARLEGHGNRVTSLSWSPHGEDRLLTVSFDGTATIWDITAGGLATANFRGHQGRLYCCVWSPRDPDLVYTGGEDQNLLAWRPSQQHHAGPSKSRRYRPPLPKGMTRRVVDDGEVDEVKKLLEEKRMELIAKGATDSEEKSSSGEKSSTTTPSVAVSSAIGSGVIPANVKDKAKRKRPGFFANTLQSEISSVESKQDSTLLLARYLRGDESELPPFLALFGRRRDLLVHMETELAGQAKAQHWDNYFTLLIWMSRVSRAAREAWSNRFVPDWLLTCLSLLGGSRGVVQLVEEKAKQVCDAGDPILGATFLLASGRTRAALELLRDKKMLREACVLAGIRLSNQDPLRLELMKLLADKETHHGTYEVAARCLLVLDCGTEAAQLLTKRGTVRAHWVGAQLLWSLGQTELARSAMFLAVNQCFLSSECRESIVEWRTEVDQSEMVEYTLLFDFLAAVTCQNDQSCYLGRLHSLMVNFPRGISRLSALEDDLLTAAISRQRSRNWDQVLAYFVYDLFLAIYQSMENLEMAPSRLLDALQSCAHNNRENTLRLARRLVCDPDEGIGEEGVRMYPTLPNSAMCLVDCVNEFIKSAEAAVNTQPNGAVSTERDVTVNANDCHIIGDSNGLPSNGVST